MKLSVNGLEAFVATGGRPFDSSLPTVVFLHGAGFDHTAWALHDRWFAHHGFAVLAPDLPGHGRSEGPPLPSIGEMADWAIALLDAAGVDGAHLVGHSMGSLIALEAAARHPERVTALSLIGTAATMTVGPDLLKAAETNDQAAVDMGSAGAWVSTPNSAGAWLRVSGCMAVRKTSCGVANPACSSTISLPAIAIRMRWRQRR
jgi:pimeloyl-ACP methyl ester carboxylesterase